jgi:hypothetical protein
MVNDVVGPSLPNGHVERVEHELRPQVAGLAHPTTRRLNASRTTAR